MKHIEKIVDVTTNEETIIERDFTKIELDEIAATKAKIESELAALEAKKIARQEILNRLGLTEEEAAVLLG